MTSLFLARILGPYLIIVTLGVLFNLKTYQKAVDYFYQTPALMYLGGVIALMTGLILVQFHNIWTPGAPMIISMLGWLALAKGVMMICFPQWLSQTGNHRKMDTLMVVRLVLILFIGIALTFLGYFSS